MKRGVPVLDVPIGRDSWCCEARPLGARMTSFSVTHVLKTFYRRGALDARIPSDACGQNPVHSVSLYDIFTI